MEIGNDNNYPGLIPPDDRHPDPGRLHRTLQDLSDDQFDLLCAARAEGELHGEALAEMDELLNSDPEKMRRADRFLELRLSPHNEVWESRSMAIRKSKTIPVVAALTALSAAAAVTLLVLLRHPSPEITSPVMFESWPELAISESQAIVREKTAVLPERRDHNPVSAAVIADAGTAERSAAFTATPSHAELIDLTFTIAEARLPDQLSGTDIQVVSCYMPSPFEIADRENWILRGIAGITKLVTGNENRPDGFQIASACINGVNNFLGWNMALDRHVSESGTPVAVSFNSRLLSFNSPAKKK